MTPRRLPEPRRPSFPASFVPVQRVAFHFSIRAFLRFLGMALAAVTFASGCAYRLGPSSGVEPGSQSVGVVPFENETSEPRVTDAISTALRAQLQQEGTFRLARARDADVVIRGAVLEITRHEESFQVQDTRTLRDYRLEILARVTAVDRVSGKTLLDREVGGHTTLRVLEDLSSAERQAMPLLAANLARNITSLLVDGDW